MQDKRRFRDFFGETEVATADEVTNTLWTSEIVPSELDEETMRYTQVVLEQYRIYVEMADRVSARRGNANTFFLTLNTSIFTLVGVGWDREPDRPTELIVVPLVVLVLQCLAWFWIVRSYRQLNSGKWAVVGALERRLPASPWWEGEWTALREGRDPGRYWPITHVEQWIPFLFAIAYVAGSLLLFT